MSWWWMERRCQQLDHRRHLGSADCWLSWLIDVADLISRFLRVFFDLTLPSDVDVLFFTSSRDPPATFRVFLTFDERTGPAAIHFVNHKLFIQKWLKTATVPSVLKSFKVFLRTLSNKQRIHFFLMSFSVPIVVTIVAIWYFNTRYFNRNMNEGECRNVYRIGLISIAECSS